MDAILMFIMIFFGVLALILLVFPMFFKVSSITDKKLANCAFSCLVLMMVTLLVAMGIELF